MPDLFKQMPTLRRVSHPLLTDRRVTLVGVSSVLHDGRAFTFEVTRPRHWGRRPDGGQTVGIGGVGGRIEPGETILTCLRREVREELGVAFQLQTSERTALIHRGELAAWLELSSSRDHPAPYVVNLLPPQLARSDRPDHLAIVTFLGRLRAQPRRGDLFGLLSIDRPTLASFFERPEWPLDEALAHPGLTFDLASSLPAHSFLRPTLTGRAFQVLLQHTSAPGQTE